MTSNLLRAVEKLRIGANERHSDQDEYVSGTYSRQISRKQTKGDIQALKHELENGFRTPRTCFDPEWLNKLQQYATQLKPVKAC